MRTAIAVKLTPALQTAAALFASLGRGHLAIMGWAFATIAAALVLAVLGWGWAFPWAVPAVVSGAAGRDAVDVPAMSYVLVLLTGLIGLALTISWWERADHTT